MKCFLTFFLSLALVPPLLSQHLIPNGDFEEFKKVPLKEHELENNLKHWKSGVPWTTPDFFVVYVGDCVQSFQEVRKRPCFSAQSGIGFVGLRLIGKGGEAIYVKLEKELKIATEYKLSFFIQLSENSAFAIDRFQIDLGKEEDSMNPCKVILKDCKLHGWARWRSKTKYGDYESLYLFRNDNQDFFMNPGEWTEVSITFKAQGGEKFIRVGNFHQTAFITSVHSSPIKNLSDKKKTKELEKTRKKLIDKGGFMKTHSLCYYLIDNVQLVEVEDP